MPSGLDLVASRFRQPIIGIRLLSVHVSMKHTPSDNEAAALCQANSLRAWQRSIPAQRRDNIQDAVTPQPDKGYPILLPPIGSRKHNSTRHHEERKPWQSSTQ
ncbi:hypothetical protein M440DRAFT_1034403 [Trichoderma longibrachiatum ATCC 18648]|uniref:Uncharacterized protein n=1 Tax=Trichoderma longibrachiatum ATCC 18648 TaxID=983965 RepID=A0A2T4BZL3_TRILO|nr:hypothetical protein M440DRAFT_1034403 [Trichoderma longibrachiatum ATCC 18648]